MTSYSVARGLRMFLLEFTCAVGANQVQVSVPDLFSEETRDIPVVLQLPAAPAPGMLCELLVLVDFEVAATKSRDSCSNQLVLK